LCTEDLQDQGQNWHARVKKFFKPDFTLIDLYSYSFEAKTAKLTTLFGGSDMNPLFISQG